MEVRPGYKQTEVGVIPDDWDVCTIQELIDRNAIVGHLDGNHGELYPRSHEFKTFGVPYITANDFSGCKVSFAQCKYLSEERARRFRKGVAKSGDVLFAHNATVGPTALLSTKLDYVILSTTATYFRCNPEKLINSFFLYALQSPVFIRQYQGVMSQSTRNQVPITAQRKLSVVLPPIKAEQEAIAEALSDADALIESLEQVTAKKRHLKQGAMQELLTGKKQLPGFGGEWEVRRLGLEIEELEAGVSVNSLDEELRSYAHDQRILKTSAVSNGFFLPNESKKIAPKDLKRARLNPRADTILISRMNTPDLVGESGYVERDYPRHFLPDRLWMTRFRPGASLCVRWLSFVLTTAENKATIKGLATGTSGSMKNISKDAFFELQIPFPDPTEQTAIATVLSDMDAEIAALEAKLGKAHQLKQGMMQELLTGRIRLV